MNYCKSAIAILLLIVAGIAMWQGAAWWSRRQWFALQSQQMATIKQLEKFPPIGSDPDTWRNALVSPYNVWGNVTYTPAYSKISNAEMRSLQRELDQILAETTRNNSTESVDRVFALLLQHGKTRFISGYREEFRTYRDTLLDGSIVARQTSESEPKAAVVP